MARRMNHRKARPISRAAALKLFARKQRNWLNVFSTTCDGFPQFTASDECPNSFQIDLIDPPLVETSYEDGIRVKRLLGDLWIVVGNPVSGASCAATINPLIFREVLMRLALKRYEIAAGAPQELIWNPMLGDDVQTDPTQAAGGDFSEGRFIREWQHLFHNQGYASYSTPGSSVVWKPRFNICGDRDGAPACVFGPEIVSGSGGGFGAVGLLPFELGGELSCVDPLEECGEDLNPSCVFGVNINDTWHIHFDLKFRRGIELRENQGLGFYGGWENLGLAPVSLRPEQPDITVKGGLRALIET